MNDIYLEDLLDEAKNPANFGQLIDPDFITTSYNASCGDVITVGIKLSEDKQTIIDIKWKGQGCIISQAAMSVLSQKLINFPVKNIANFTQKELLQALGLQEISMGRVKCLMLGLNAIKNTLKKNNRFLEEAT